RDIAELYGANVIEHAWEGFRDQKNFAIGLATHEWILSMDADEELNEALQLSIRNFISNPKQPHTAARFSRKTFFLDEWILHGDWYPDYIIRMFRNGHGVFTGGNVHERLEVDGKIATLSGDVLHYPAESLLEFTRKNIVYADIAAIDMFNSRKKVSVFSALMHGCWAFLRGFIFRLGFLDGYHGYFVAKMKSFLCMYKYFKLYTLLKKGSL
ncbi:MAG: glycosyltransferase family 2 protein, partial [Puniceicoccales bacterium]|nr:glycosyltransferase family 2 protein [Puniceicoccales bacterium]